MFFQFGVFFAEDADHRVDEAAEEQFFNSQQAAEADGAAQDTAQDVAAAFVGRQDTVADHDRNRPDVVGNDLHGHFLIGIVVIAMAEGDDVFDNRENQIRFKVRFLLLDNRSQPFQAGACIDVFLSQRHVFAVFGAVKLGKYEVPDFQVAVAVTAYGAGRLAAAPFRSQVVENFAVRSAGAFADFPEVVFKFEDAVVRQADHVVPVIISFVVVRINRNVQLVLIQFEDFRQEFPRPGDGFFFEVVAEGEVPQHFKKRMVTGRAADVVDIAGADALLARRNPVGRRYELARKIRLQRSHAGANEQQARVVLGNQGKTMQNQMLLAFEKFQIGFADFITRHVFHQQHSPVFFIWKNYTLICPRWATFSLIFFTYFYKFFIIRNG